jgi:hypothetical protein
MNLADLPGMLFAGVLQKWKRRAIVYAICAVCALGILIEFVAIGRILLERALGPIGGRLLVAGILLAVICIALLTLWMLERRAHAARAASVGAGTENDPRVAVIAQAINLGYTVARGFGDERPREAPTPPVSESPPDTPEQPRAQAAE